MADKTVKLTVTLSEDKLEELRKHAKRLEMPVATYAMMLITCGLTNVREHRAD